MRSLLRYIIGLVTSVALFLLVLGILIWLRYQSIDSYAHRVDHFFVPSQQHLSNSLRRLDNAVTEASSTASGPLGLAIPSRLQLEAHLSVVGDHLAEVMRLANQFEYDGAFDLPLRANRRFQRLRPLILADIAARPPRVAEAVAMLSSMQDSLKQLERIYELDKIDWRAREQEVVRASTRYVVFAIIALCVGVVPLIIGMTMGLRDIMRSEIRNRNDLEDAKEQLESMALYDQLTSLGNRYLFKSRLEQVTSAAPRSGRTSALLYIDLDNFKRINDSLGHDVGDEVLKAVGARLKDHVRAGDTVARIGGDEFAIVIYDSLGGPAIGSIAHKLLKSIREPIVVSGHELVLSASIGITVIPSDGDHPAALMKNADMAVYRAKDLGRDNFQFFVEEMNRAAAQQRMVEQELRSAIQAQRLELHYQPLVALETGEIAGVEALLRLTTAAGESIPPDRFIPVAESTGLLIEIGDWIFAQACRDLVVLRARGHGDLRVSVNLSARQLHDPQLPARISAALAASCLSADALQLEITESTLIKDMDSAVYTLQALRRLGITVAVDDFGIGYSSLNYLKRLPLDALKIDRSFVRGIESDLDDRSIVDAILAMADSLSLKVVAEGIESQWQLNYLAQKGCDLGQGFLLGRPVARDELSFRGGAGSGRRHPPARDGLHLV